MWLPTRIYEALPTIYVIIGLIFLAGASYINTYSALAPMYFVMGVFSVVGGLIVGQRRLNARRSKQAADNNRVV